jgi:hypothetical protein
MIKWPRIGLEAALSTCSALSVERQLLGSGLYDFYFGFGPIAGPHERPLTGTRLLWLWRSETAQR